MSFFKNTIEDECHALLHCPLYTDFREILFKEAEFYNNGFKNLNDDQKLVFLFSDENVLRVCAKTCNLILDKHRNFVYCKKI